jgi:REP element-mobilizing transposase RayT
VKVKERRHRLPKEFYKREISVAFTLCLKGDVAAAPNAFGVSLREPEIVNIFTAILSSAASKAECIVPVYCFMPDHQHLIISGMHDNSDVWKTIVTYKQKTGFWMSANKTEIKWQKDFYDHILKKHEDIAIQVRYILDNPVRKGLVPSWQEYPFKCSIGCNMEDVLKGVII